jgi:exoribonuclease-2
MSGKIVEMARLTAIARRVMMQRGLQPDFSPPALAEVDAIVRPATVHDADVRDLRSLLWASIDNDTSRDLDQLSAADDLAGGMTSVFVAIADVDALVKKGTAIDAHAQANTTTVYTAAQIFPMLPEKLSTDLSSLGEGQERLSVVVEMTVGEDGRVVRWDLYRAAVVNRAKLAYNSVAAWLEGAGPMPPAIAAVPGLDDRLRLQDRAAQAMRKLRYEHGALNLETPQAQAVFDGDILTDLQPDRPNRAKQLIEDFMIAANGVTARFLSGKGFPTVRRVLRTPARWDRIVALAAAAGERLPREPDGRALADFLARRRAHDPATFGDLSLSVVKLLGRGEYVAEGAERAAQTADGHFGLAVSDYTHSTAPNRRFPDILTQRLLKAAMHGQPPPYSDEELALLARHCTEQETNAAKVERQVAKSAAAQLLAPRIGERFDAVVTGVTDAGVWVRIAHPAVEGKVVRHSAGLDVGDRIRVELVQTDIEQGFVDFAALERR